MFMPVKQNTAEPRYNDIRVSNFSSITSKYSVAPINSSLLTIKLYWL